MRIDNVSKVKYLNVLIVIYFYVKCWIFIQNMLLASLLQMCESAINTSNVELTKSFLLLAANYMEA